MKLYFNPISDNCRRVLATIHHIGRTDVELVPVDLMKGDHMKPEYLALNPNGKVPTLVDGDTTLWESVAIMQYLSSDSSLWPASKARYDIIRWQVWGVVHLGPAVGKIVGERVVKPLLRKTAPDETVVAQGLEELDRFAKVLNGHLQGRDYLVGSDLTLADLSVAASFTYAKPAKIDLAPYPNVARWYASIEALDAWKKSAPPPMG